MRPLEILDRMDRSNIAPAWWPPDELDALIDDWRTAATEAVHESSVLEFVLCAGFALTLRNARFIRRVIGKWR